MKKVIDWFNSQSKQSRTLFLIATTGYFLLAIRIIITRFHLVKLGLGAFIGRSLGEFIGIAWLPIIVSLAVSYILFLSFKGFAEKAKKYFDYFSIVLLIVTTIFVWLVFSAGR